VPRCCQGRCCTSVLYGARRTWSASSPGSGCGLGRGGGDQARTVRSVSRPGRVPDTFLSRFTVSTHARPVAGRVRYPGLHVSRWPAAGSRSGRRPADVRGYGASGFAGDLHQDVPLAVFSSAQTPPALVGSLMLPIIPRAMADRGHRCRGCPSRSGPAGGLALVSAECP